MIVLENPSGRMNAGERAFVAHQRGKDGIALVNFMVGGGGPRKPGREVDVILILPHGIFSVEVKYTTAVGELDSPLNDSWSVGEITTPFSSRSRTPAAQADQAAKILASALESKDWPKDYITPIVAIHGKVTIPEKARWVGTVGVSTVEHFDLLVKQTKSKRLHAKNIGPMLERLGVSKVNVPSMERLLGEGFSDGTAQPAPPPVKKQPQVTPTAPPAPEEPTPPGPHWYARPVSESTGARVRLLSLTALVVLAGVWELMRGHLFMLVAQPVTGQDFFIYGTWQEGASRGSLDAGAAPLVGVVLLTLFGIAQWLRLGVGGVTARSTAGFLASVFAVVAGAPILFSGSGWIGVWITWLLYTCLWPFTAIVVREVGKPLSEQVNRVWREYEI